MRRHLLGAAVVIAALPVLAAGAVWAAAPSVTVALDDDAYHLLVLGSDADPFHGQGSRDRGTVATRGRADAIHLVSISADRQHVSIVSFPRDTPAYVPGFGRTKMNAGLTGGPGTMVEVIEAMTGVDVDDWAVTSFSGLANGIEALGGVTIDVEQRLNDRKGAGSDLQPGVQHLSGWQALTYARDRYSRGNGDVGRSTAQARVLQAIHDQFLVDADLPTLMRLLPILHRNVATSISPRRMVALASLASRTSPDQVVHVQLGGVNEGVFAQLRVDGHATG